MLRPITVTLERRRDGCPVAARMVRISDGARWVELTAAEWLAIDDDSVALRALLRRHGRDVIG